MTQRNGRVFFDDLVLMCTASHDAWGPEWQRRWPEELKSTVNYLLYLSSYNSSNFAGFFYFSALWSSRKAALRSSDLDNHPSVLAPSRATSPKRGHQRIQSGLRSTPGTIPTQTVSFCAHDFIRNPAWSLFSNFLKKNPWNSTCYPITPAVLLSRVLGITWLVLVEVKKIRNPGCKVVTQVAISAQ